MLGGRPPEKYMYAYWKEVLLKINCDVFTIFFQLLIFFYTLSNSMCLIMKILSFELSVLLSHVHQITDNA